jgi:hypothetical protein
VDEAIDLLTQARSANPRLYFVRLILAAALGLKGDVERAKLELVEHLKLKPEINCIKGLAVAHPWVTHPEGMALREKTVHIGLRRAGMPDE